MKQAGRVAIVPGASAGDRAPALAFARASAAVDGERRRVFFATAPGEAQPDVFAPQRPTMHVLDLDTGAVALAGLGRRRRRLAWRNGSTRA